MKGEARQAHADGPPAVAFEDVSFSYPGAERPALSGVSFEVRAGERVGVVGPNGGGKSTLARLVNGLLVAEDGAVRVFGLDPARQAREVRRKVGMLFQNPENGLVAPTVEDDVAFGLENAGVPRGEMRERVRGAMAAVGLAGYERREPHALSGGEQARVGLAGLLALDPEVLVLDEPTSMLDAPGRREVLGRIGALAGGRTVLHVTHHLEEVASADRVLVVNGGRLVADTTPERLFSDAALLRENRLVLPTVPRLAAALGLGVLHEPEDLAKAVRERVRTARGLRSR